MITNIINPILIFIQTLLFPFWEIILYFGVGYLFYWLIGYYLSSEEKEPSFKNELFKKTVIRIAYGSFFMGFGSALIFQDFENKYIHITFPLISLSLPILMLFIFSINSIVYETYKRSKGSKE